MSDNRYPRDGVPSTFEGYPAFGAVHEVIPNERLNNFLFDFSRISDLVIKQCLADIDPQEITKDDFKNKEYFAGASSRLPDNGEWEDYDPRRYYKVFHVDTLGVSVVEMDESAKAARSVRAVWERQDFGSVEQEARDMVARQSGIFTPRIRFSSVMGAGRRLPEVDKKEVRQKLALLPDTSYHPETTELLELEAESINEAIKRRLKQFMGPWDTIPHLTFAVFRQRTPAEAIPVIKRSSKNYVELYPFEVRLGDLAFRHKSLRGKHSR